jgi:LysR substrate binding domain
MGWNEVTTRICRQHGRFEPDIRHRTNDALVSLQVVRRGLAAMIIPQLSATEPHPDVAIRGIRGASLTRTIFAATRTADANRLSIRTALDALHAATAAVAKHPPTNPDLTSNERGYRDPHSLHRQASPRRRREPPFARQAGGRRPVIGPAPGPAQSRAGAGCAPGGGHGSRAIAAGACF